MTARGRPALMIVHAYYEEDPRVRRQAETLTEAGRPVHVIGLRRQDDPVDSELAGVRIRHLDVQRHQGAGLGTYLGEYLAFVLARCAPQSGCIGRNGSPSSRSTPTRLPGLRGPPIAARRCARAARPARGDAGVLPEPLPGRSGTRCRHRLLLLQERLSIAFVDRDHHGHPAMRDRLLRWAFRRPRPSVS